MADTISQLRVREKLKLCSKLVYAGVWSFWSRCSNHTFKIVNNGSNMAVDNSEKASVLIEIRVQRLSRSLIRFCHQTLEIQSDGKSSREAMILLKNSIKGFQKSLIKILLLDLLKFKYFKSKRKASIWRLKIKKRLSFYWNYCTGVFEVGDPDLAIRFSKFKIAEPIWEWQVWEKVKLWWNLVYGGFRSCWSRFSYHIFYIVNDGSNMAVENLKKA